MTPEEFDAIQTRYDAADKVAPMSNWQMVDTECNCDCQHVRFDDNDNDIEIDCESGECADCLKELRANQSGLLTQTDGDYWYFHPRTLEFILACRQDIPALLAEIERLKAELNVSNHEANLRAENEKLREIIKLSEAVCEAAHPVVAQFMEGVDLLGSDLDRLMDQYRAWRKAKGE